MSITHQQSLSISSSGGGPNVGGSVTEIGGTETVINTVFAGSLTNSLFAMAFVAANLQSIVLVASQPITIKTNSGSSPANTINLLAGIPLVWSKSSAYFANPFTSDVTAWYITTTGASGLKGKILTT